MCGFSKIKVGWLVGASSFIKDVRKVWMDGWMDLLLVLDDLIHNSLNREVLS